MKSRVHILLALTLCAILSSPATAAVTVTETFFPDESGQIDLRLIVPAEPLDQSVDLLADTAGDQGLTFRNQMNAFLTAQPIDPYTSPAMDFLKTLSNSLLGNLYTADPAGTDPKAYRQSLRATKDGGNYVIDAVWVVPSMTALGANAGIQSNMAQNDDGGFTINVSVSLPPGAAPTAQDLRTLFGNNLDQSLIASLAIVSAQASPASINSASVAPLRPQMDAVADALTTVEYIMVMPGAVTTSRGTRSEGRRSYWNVNLNNILTGGTVEFSATCSAPGVEVPSEQAQLAAAMQAAIDSHKSSIASAAVVEGATEAASGEPQPYVPDEAAYLANLGHGFLRNQQFQEALQAYDQARTLAPTKYEWAYSMAKHMAENANQGVAMLGRMRVPFPDTDLTFGEYFGWTAPTLTGPASFSPAEYQEYLRQQQQWQRYNPGAVPAQPAPGPQR